MDPKIIAILEAAIKNRVFPGCSIAVIDGDTSSQAAFGHFTYKDDSPRVTTHTQYDCASLSKIIGPMSVAQQLIDEGVIALDEFVGTYLPEFVSEPQKAAVTIRHLMTYTLDYNIPAGSKSLLGTLTPEQVATNAITYKLKHAPGTNYMYSNITAFILTQVIERVTGANFYDLVQERVFTPLQMETATFMPEVSKRTLIPPTEVTNERGVVQGFVHDEFTDRTTQGNISNGAAGLFVSMHDVNAFLDMTIRGGVVGTTRLFSEKTVQAWTEEQFPHLLPTLTPLGCGDQNNVLLDSYHRQMVIKSGFTGCFMMGDLVNKKGFAILSNRTYPTRPDNASAFIEVREKVMEVVFG